jgi:hypothetical protein
MADLLLVQHMLGVSCAAGRWQSMLLHLTYEWMVWCQGLREAPHDVCDVSYDVLE